MADRGNSGRGRPPPPPPRGRSGAPTNRARLPPPPRQPGIRRGIDQSFSSNIDRTTFLSYSSSSSSSDQTQQTRGGIRQRPPSSGIYGPNVSSLSQRMAELDITVLPETTVGRQTTQASLATPPDIDSTSEASSTSTALHTEDLSCSPQYYSGTSGKTIDMSCNYLKLVIDEEMGVFHYAVNFNPRIDNRDERFRLLNQQRELFDGGVKVFDGAALFVRKKLDGGDKTVISTNERGESVQLTFSFKRKCDAGDHNVVQLYNILFGRVFRSLKFSQHKRKYFDSQGAFLIRQHNINVWPGYITAVDQYESGLLIQMDASFRVLRTETVRDLLMNIKKNTSASEFKAKAEKELLGTSVLTRYNNKSYVVDDIDFNSSVKDTFENEKGESMSFIDYYKNQYNIEIMDKDQPLLINRVKKKSAGEQDVERMICLVPELCLLTGLTDAMRADFRVMQEVAKFTRINPQKRLEVINNFIDRVNGNEIARQILSDWGLHIVPTPVKLRGRELQPDYLYFGGNQKEMVSPKGDWNRAATSKPVLTAVPLRKWALLYPRRNESEVKSFCQTLVQQAKRMGIEISRPQPTPLDNDRNETYVATLKRYVADETPQLVLTIFPQMKADRYSAVKRLCCSEMPVASQVVNLKTITNPKRLTSVCQKIALQINCKLGGELWGIETPFKNLMVVGIDVFHEKSRKSGSVAGIVASLNDYQSRFYSCAARQKDGQEMIDVLTTAFLEALKVYFRENHCWPSEIVVFRDGVGDGELESVRVHETAQFTNVFSKVAALSPDLTATLSESKSSSASSRATFARYSPGFSFVVVQKRINTRIFSALRGTFENPNPGTIVDHTITRYKFKDFFLVPQSVTQGTVTPTHFVIIEESNSTLMNADNLQKLSYKMTHMYYNWPGTVRVPAPCQYAHKLVELVGEHIRIDPSKELNHRLYYL